VAAGAAELFAERGYANTTLEDLATHLGVAKPTIYQYVKSKGALLEAIVEPVFKRLLDSNSKALASSDDPAGQVTALVRGMALVIADSVTAFLVFLGDEKELPPRRRRKFDRWQRDIASTLEQALASWWYDPAGPMGPEALADQALVLTAGCFVVPAPG
jgi:AcrR family transcriptional regulator